MKTLIILAAGNGTRFGGPKQLTGFGPLQRPLMAYNIDHAYQAGYRQFIIVCQQQHENSIKALPFYQYYTDCTYHIVIQSNQHLPTSVVTAVEHEKPLGTAHALWCCHQLITDNFTVINGDDYYGAHAFKLLFDANLQNNQQHHLVGYPVINTLSEHGGVNRGLCAMSAQNHLTHIAEATNIFCRETNTVIGQSDNGNIINIEKNTLVSMNCWSFHPSIINSLATLIAQLLNSPQSTKECFLPDAAMHTIKEGKYSISVLTSHDDWFGVTYAADSKLVNEKLAKLTEKGLFH